MVAEHAQADAVHNKHIGIAAPLEVGAVLVVLPAMRERADFRLLHFFRSLKRCARALRFGLQFGGLSELAKRRGEIPLLVGVGAPVVLDLRRIGSCGRCALEPGVGRFVLAVPVEHLCEIELSARNRIAAQHVVRKAVLVPVGRDDARRKAEVVVFRRDKAGV